MTDIWKEREKALENEYIYRKERERLEKARTAAAEQLVREVSRNHCPKCGTALKAMTFRGVPLDKCPGCGGVWLGPRDLQTLASKDHRTWFEQWFRDGDGE